MPFEKVSFVLTFCTPQSGWWAEHARRSQRSPLNRSLLPFEKVSFVSSAYLRAGGGQSMHGVPCRVSNVASGFGLCIWFVYLVCMFSLHVCRFDLCVWFRHLVCIFGLYVWFVRLVCMLIYMFDL